MHHGHSHSHSHPHEQGHDHNHGHGHGHAHLHLPSRWNRLFFIGIVLNVGFVIVEVAFGLLTNSLALLADAGHNLSDVLGLLLAWGASLLTQKPPTGRYTYGLRRSSILGALLNSTILLVVMGGIAWEAIQRFQEPTELSGGTMIGVALVGVIINTLTALLFVSDRKKDLNIRGAFLHMAADALVSLGVVLAGVAILLTGLQWFDPVISLIIVVVIVVGTWNLLKESLSLVMDAVPSQIEPATVRLFLTEMAGVQRVHDLHIWAISTSETALTAHLVMPNGHPGDAFLSEVCCQLRDRFRIHHPTLQIELGDSEHQCALEPDDHV